MTTEELKPLRCEACGGLINQQTGECRCSD